MEADVLRLILLALGSVLVVGIFLWDRYKRSRTRLKGLSARKVRRQPLFTPRDAEPGVPEQQELPSMSVADEGPDTVAEETEPRREHDFSALDEQDYVHMNPDLENELPRMVIQIGLMAKKGGYNGEDIHAAMQDVDLHYGDMGIYHRHQGKAGKRALFSVASMVEPGQFPKSRRA